MRLGLAAFIMLTLAGPALAQQQHNQAPYAGLQQRAIKALSDQQVADLRIGRGMGLALAAELNGYPGPLHVLELSEKLGLTAQQRQCVQALFDAMKAEAIPIGERLIQHEADLDRLFSTRTITPASLTAATQAIGAMQATLRNAHLSYHLSTVAVLTPEQVRRYGELRGYADGNGHTGHHR